jgi:hypothetical protein
VIADTFAVGLAPTAIRAAWYSATSRQSAWDSGNRIAVIGTM